MARAYLLHDLVNVGQFLHLLKSWKDVLGLVAKDTDRLFACLLLYILREGRMSICSNTNPKMWVTGLTAR